MGKEGLNVALRAATNQIKDHPCIFVIEIRQIEACVPIVSSVDVLVPAFAFTITYTITTKAATAAQG